MIKLRRCGLICLCLAVLLALAVSPITAYAGSSDVNVASSASFSKVLDESTWRTAGGVTASKGKIVFNEDCRASARITTRGFFKDCSYGGIDEIFRSAYSLTINDIPETDNARFAFVSGLQDVGDKLESDGASEVYFVKDGGALKIGVAIIEGDARKEIVAPKAVDGLAFGSSFDLNVSLVADGYLTVTLTVAGGSETVICDDGTKGNVGHVLEGFLSIGQTAVCNAEISSVSILAHDYKNAETPLVITETFDNDAYNGNAFYTQSDIDDTYTADGGVRVENGTLRFIGRPCFLSTKYSYSNFELTFDLTDVTRKNVTDDDGNVILKKANGWFGVSLESSVATGKFDNHARTSMLFTMEIESKEIKTYNRLSLDDFTQYPALYKEGDMDILSEANDGKIYNFKVVMHDGKFSVTYKLSDAENYPEVPLYSTDLGYTPYGSVAILSYGNSGYTLDNIKITNNDYAPVDVRIDYVGVKNRTEPDYAYEDKWTDDDLITGKTGKTEKSGCGASLSVCALLPLAVCFFGVATIRRKNKDE